MTKSTRRALSGPEAERLQKEQLAALLRHTPAVMAANVCNALVFVAANWGTESFRLALGWATAVSLISSYVIARRWRRRGQSASVAAAHGRGPSRVMINALALGLAWAALPLLFFDRSTTGGKLLIACLSSGMLGGGVFALASIPLSAIAFSGPIAVGSLIALLRVGDLEHNLMAIVLTVYSAVLFFGAFNYANGLRDLVKTQIAAEERASASSENLNALGELAAGLAHEISQPLAAASAYVASAEQLLALPAENRHVAPERALRDAANQLDVARQIIGSLRHAIISGEIQSSFLRLHELIERVCEANQARARQAHVVIETNLTAPNDLVVGNAVQLRQVLNNLISNAIDATPSNDAAGKVTITTRAEGRAFIRVDVTDLGVGISPAIKTKLFEPLITTKSGGLGVGLSIARSIVEKHKGRIWAEPNPGGGSVFSLLLPVEDDTTLG